MSSTRAAAFDGAAELLARDYARQLAQLLHMANMQEERRASELRLSDSNSLSCCQIC
jgi:hypothetical protein